jgi:four helix bundle protein
MTEKIKSFRDLDAWKKGIKIVRDIYRVTSALPKHQSHGLISQMQRATVSIPSNIAEGFNRFQNKEYKRFLYIASGSCAELETIRRQQSRRCNKKAIFQPILFLDCWLPLF